MEIKFHKPPITVSVIMNCLNCSKYLPEAIDSVYAQTYKDWEIIFWDNASTDDSANIAKSYDARLRVFRSNEVVPLGKARNWAIEKASGKYIAFLDCDDRWLPRKIEKQVHILESRPDVDFVYSNYFRIIMPRADRLILGLKGKMPEGNVFERFLYHYPVNMQTVMIRKKVLEGMDGLFDETLKLSEEYDFFMRILYRARALYINEPLIVYRIHSNMSSLKYIGDFPVELSYIVNKFLTIYPALQGQYPKELHYLKAKIAYWRARADMVNGNIRNARLSLRPFKWTGYKFFFLFIMTFLPARFWFVAHNLKDKGVIR